MYLLYDVLIPGITDTIDDQLSTGIADIMFFYSLPILFNDIKLVNPFEFFLLVVTTLAVLYATAPQPELSWQQPPYERFVFESWVGGVSLFWVFWPYFILLNASLLTADILAKAGKITVSSWDEIHFALLLTAIWWTISIWRCSSNTALRIWPALARLTTISVFIEYALKLLIRIDYPRIFFNCEEILLDYGSCF